MISKDDLAKIAERANRNAQNGDSAVSQVVKSLTSFFGRKDANPVDQSATEPAKQIETVASTAEPRRGVFDVDLSTGPKPAARDTATDFEKQEFGGYSLDQLRQMRDFKRDRVPDAYTVKEWRQAVRKEIQRWASQATRPDALASPAESKSQLSDDDRRLLVSRAADVMDDKEKFDRRFTLLGGEHPDTGESFDVEAETVAAKRSMHQENVETITEAESQGTRPDDDGDDEELPDRNRTALDMAQLGADAAGIVDPTGIVDGANAVVSLARAVKEPDRRGEHLKNAVISAISVIPYIGDTAKLAKLGRAKKTVKGAAKLSEAGKAEKSGGFADMMINAAATLGPALGAGGGGGGDDDGKGTSSPGSGDSGPGNSRTAGQVFQNFLDKLTELSFVAGKAIAGLVATLEASRLGNRFNVNQNADLAEYDSELASAYAQREVADIRRKIREGREMSGSLSDAAQADTVAEDVRSEIVTPFKTIFTDLTATASRFQWSLIGSIDRFTRFSELMERTAETIDKMTDKIDAFSDYMLGRDGTDDRDEDTQWGRFFDDIADGNFDDETARDRFFDEWNGDGRREERRQRRRRQS